MPDPHETASGLVDVNGRLLDPAYSQIHREQLLEGRWFHQGDADVPAPPVVITEALWDRTGRVR